MPLNELPWAAIFVGWPAVIASITLVMVGIARARGYLVLVGALLACPFLLYLFASPRIRWLAPIVGALYVWSSAAAGRSQRGLALFMTTPFVLLAGFVAWIVLNQ
jgi:hypothetical protein